MERIKKEDLEKMYGKEIEERTLNILGVGKMKGWEIYDGFAYCPDFKGHEYAMKFPKLDFIEDTVEMQKTIRKKLKMNDTDKISAFDILQVFNRLSCDGTRIEFNPRTRGYKEETRWLLKYIPHEKIA